MATEQKKPAYIKYLFGGLAGMGATTFVQPLDLVKNRMQLQGAGGGKKEYKNTFDALTKILRNEGVTGIYRGLGAGFMRQATYTTTRLGVYTGLNDSYKNKYEGQPGLLASMLMGIIAGATGAFVGTPAEVALIRMTADGRLPIAERRNYTGVFNALARITREEGVLTLWRGCIPTMGRAMVVNAAQLASYSQAKQYLVRSGYFTEGIKLHFVASMMSGFITTVASMPVDIAKTRLQNMKVSTDGKAEYRGTVDVLSRVVRQEGLFALWKGFTPYFCRLGPHTVLTFIFLEQMNTAYNKYVLGISGGSSGL
ncbi:mitochondrial 2-oxoglutarate/malate carrier protein-like [Sitodiplosis mosellana]|uniref:mitochondrial 2-oxoglutarate/malate carrier protein-like n=1 Tax=Sitodiplosis mosellana TaxID=263140 RepID=UPI002444BF6F|nr:mitochondrial 2-oxoglutarate/malate carrier protein-like [Sitodiplosis mosellana]XP_055313539.1 mitochondrial 2-oxoglutarate/malate carrier protein-like [Sitodiplosis mosellana]XP_055313540.1 mitochondrial 2-oxoglutarate/malate carrier protein-like [Sitodiplosis mosellana]